MFMQSRALVTKSGFQKVICDLANGDVQDADGISIVIANQRKGELQATYSVKVSPDTFARVNNQLWAQSVATSPEDDKYLPLGKGMLVVNEIWYPDATNRPVMCNDGKALTTSNRLMVWCK